MSKRTPAPQIARDAGAEACLLQMPDETGNRSVIVMGHDRLELYPRELHLPHRESDHVLTHGNVFVGGDCIENIASLRNSQAFLTLMGACRVPDSTTAGGFLQRITTHDPGVVGRPADESRVKTKYGSSRVIAVEPSSSNACLARLNLSGSDFQSEVIEAAVGPLDGSAFFQESEDSNQGRVSTKGTPVRMVSMDSVLKKLPENMTVDLLKMDIEGGEETLLSRNLGWLSRVRSIIAEFHPTLVDYEGLVRKIEGQGFRYFPANSVRPGSMDAFLREKWSGWYLRIARRSSSASLQSRH